jgi:translation initiation factor IF-2
MENTDRTRNQGGQGQGNKPGQGGAQKGGREGQGGTQKPGQGGSQKPGQGGREGQGTSQDGRPTPSGVPNEGRETGGRGGYEYKGGRQGTGGVPNPDDQDDLDSAGSFRGTAEQGVGEDDDDIDQGLRTRQDRNQDTTSQPRNPK